MYTGIRSCQFDLVAAPLWDERNEQRKLSSSQIVCDPNEA